MKKQQTATVHRFYNAVALHSDDTPTVYLSAQMARQLAAALVRFADDIEKVDFVSSHLGTVTIDDR